MRKSLTALVTVGLFAACGGGNGPAVVAEAFWEASRTGDYELAQSYVAEGGNASISEEAAQNQQIREFTLGESHVEGDSAAVETSLSGDFGENPVDVEFNTVMVRQEGEWKVDLDGTANEMMKAILGVSMNDFAEQMGEAMGEAMKGMAEGMAEGMKEGMKAAADSMEQQQR